MDLIHLRSMAFGVPLAIHQEKFDAIMGAVGARLGVEVTAEQIEAASQPFKSQSNNYTIQNGIAVIPINGSLMKKTYGLLAASGCSSYETIGAQLQDAIKSPEVKGVLLDINSPGGTTSGLFELADTIYSLRGDKPIYAVSNDAAFSAAYALASCADQIYVTRTGGVGSIGVFCCHVDQSGADSKAGLKYTFIHAGAKKIDGNAHEPLSESALDDTQAEVDREYRMFTTLVARNRNAKLQAIVDTQAGVFFGETALPLLADKVGTFDDAMKALIGETQTLNKTTKSISGGGRKASLNTSSKAEEEETAIMAKKKNLTVTVDDKQAEASIDELVAKHATEASDEDEMEKECNADAKAADPDDDEDDDAEPEDKKDDKEATAHADAITIVNLCNLAGMPALASTFLVENYSVAQVTKALLKHRAEKSKTVKIASGSVNNTNALSAAYDRIMSDKTITNKSEAYAKFLKANAQEYKAYLQSRG